jgi:hypothetical protein
MKSVLAASLLLTLLCGPALAESTATYSIELATKTTRQTILVADRSCGEIQLKSPNRESFLKVCAVATENGKHVRLEVERRTRENQEETRQAAVVMAASGASYDLLDGKLTVKTQ